MGERNQIFVFGSNLAGRHGAGSAKEAIQNWGAEYGIGFGPRGASFAIPTKGFALERLPLTQIHVYVQAFLTYASIHPEKDFEIVAIGCGLAGYKPSEIAPMFRHAPANCKLPRVFQHELGVQS